MFLNQQVHGGCQHTDEEGTLINNARRRKGPPAIRMGLFAFFGKDWRENLLPDIGPVCCFALTCILFSPGAAGRDTPPI
jgi:hypothetical protein